MTDERVQLMARAYVERGLSYAQIAEEWDVTKQRVGQLLGPLGLAKNRVKIDKAIRMQNLQAAHHKILAGEATLDEMAEKMGYASGRSLRAVLDKLGLHVVMEKEPPPHGTTARYDSRSDPCRCAECRRANREKSRTRVGLEPPTHGASGYQNYGCRCKICTEGQRLAVRKRRAQKRRKKEVVV